MAPRVDQRRRELFRRRAIQGAAVLLGRHLRHDRQIADGAHGGDGRADLVQITEGLEHEQVHAAREQRLGLLAEVRLGLVDADLAPRLDADAERSHRAGHVRLIAGGVARDPHARHIDGVQLVGKPEGGELQPVCAECVGLEHVGAGAHVLAVHAADQVGIGQIQRVERLVDEDALRVEHRAHRAVAHEHPLLERIHERCHQAAWGRSTLRQRNVSASTIR